MRRQQGMTLIGMVIVAFIAGIFVLAGIRLVAGLPRVHEGQLGASTP
jgi:type II secretory pathway pseudopilin PulG